MLCGLSDKAGALCNNSGLIFGSYQERVPVAILEHKHGREEDLRREHLNEQTHSAE